MKVRPENAIQMIEKKQVIKNTASALEGLSGLIDSLEKRLLGVPHNIAKAPDLSIHHQDIDLISQTVEELRHLLLRLASITSETERISVDDVIIPIRLERLRAIVLSGAAVSDGLSSHNASSSMQLFD
jgi:hypothetical protein